MTERADVAEGSGIWTPPGGSADAGREGETPPREAAQETITEEQLLEAIRRMKVSDVLVSTFATVAQLGYAKLEPSSRDLEQAKLAIESLRALVPVLEPTIPPETTRDFNQLIANLQLAYATAASGPAASDPAASEGEAPEHVPDGEERAGG